MELRASDFAKVCNVTRQSFHTAKIKNKVISNNDEIPKYNIHEPVNLEYLKAHNKSVLDVQDYIKSKPVKVIRCRPRVQDKKVVVEKKEDQSIVLLKCVDLVLTREYSIDESKKIKLMILQEMKKQI